MFRTSLVISNKTGKNGGDYILSVKGNQGSQEKEVHSTCNRNRPVFDNCIVEKGQWKRIFTI